MHSTFTYRGGDRIADFSVISAVAVGAFGEVYLVRDLSGAVLALKLLKGDFGCEMSAVSDFRQKVGGESGLVAIHHVGEFEGQIYYTMDAADNLSSKDGEYCPDTLENRLAFNGALNAFEVLDIAESLARAIDGLHAHGLVHRDLKPANVIFRDKKPLLADFGLISPTDGGSAGTPGYMPPEALPANVSVAAHQARDFYALGKLIYCALTNEDADRFPVLPKAYSLKEVAALRKVWLKACAPKPSQRFSDGASFIAALQAARRELCGVVGGRGHRWMIGAFAVAAVALVVAAAYFVFRPHAAASGEEVSTYVNIEETENDYLAFCCFTAGSDKDPMSESNRRKAADLTIDALRRYRKLPAELTIKARNVTREREPERNGGLLLYYYRVPIASCEIQGIK